jgi:anti-sigma factor RsiW
MSCSPFDLRDFVLKELSEPEARQVDAHVRGCAGCREEMERLHLTEAALFALRDEEIPQRIAFVSDKIFEPSPWRRAWTAFWDSTARLGFASAAVLSVAVIVFSLARPAGAPVSGGPAAVRVVQPASVSEVEIQQRVQAAVDQAVAASETRLQKSFDQRVKEMDQRNQAMLLSAASELRFAEKAQMAVMRSDYTLPRRSPGDFK